MKAMKQFLALLIILAVLTISVIVAFRLAPETWAMVAGVIFGVVAALPMCAVVIMMLRQRPAPPPQVMPTPQPPQVILLHPGGPMPYPYTGQAPAPQAMLPMPNPAYYQAPPTPPAQYAAPAEWPDLEAEDEAEYWTPSAAPKPSYRILG